MRVIIEPNYEKLSQWAADYVVNKINAAFNLNDVFFAHFVTAGIFYYGNAAVKLV